MNKLSIMLILLFAIVFPSFAQQKNYSGTVSSTSGESLIGATVMVKGTNKAAVTDLDGKFTIQAKPGSTLSVSYVGFKPQEIKVGVATDLNIVMHEDANTLDEMVVVGYGTMKKADLTGAVSSVNGGTLEDIRSTSVTQSLQGAVPGLFVTRSSGKPGAGGTIKVRGVTTIGETSPLVIVDGVPDSIESVNSSDIESVTVLKDAASASIYGARAAAGVILVTTKKPKEGKARITYQGTVGFVEQTETPKAVTPIQYMNMVNELKWNDGGNLPGMEDSYFPQEDIDSYLENHALNPDQYPLTDWRAVLTRKTAPTTKHDVKVSYGNKVVQTKISLGYEYTEALYKHYDYQRFNARVNNNFKITKWLSVGLDAYWRRGLTNTPKVNPLQATLFMDPLSAAYNSNGTVAAGHDGSNPWAQLEYGGEDKSIGDRFGAKLSINITPIEGLTISGVWAPGILYSQHRSFRKRIPYYTPDNPDEEAGTVNSFSLNGLSEERNNTVWGTKQLIVNYHKTFVEDHRADIMIGYEDYTNKNNTVGAQSHEMQLSDYFYLNNANKNNIEVSGSASENAYRSIFGRINYAYKNRYMAQFNVRWDRSSRFARKYRTGFFPSGSVGWVMSEESWLRNVDPRALTYLKIRGSYGTLGNERIGNYPYQASMSFENVVRPDTQGGLVARPSAYQLEYNIPDITWETTHSWDIGLDASFLNSRLSVNFDWYWKKTKNMLLSIQLPVYMGYDNPKQNAGDMTTKGWDLQLGWRDNVGDFSYSVNVNLSDYRSVMGNMTGTVITGSGTISREGDEYHAFYGFLSDGLYQTEEELANCPRLNNSVQLGDIKYKDISGPDGVPDGKVNTQYDRVILGPSQPRLIYGAQLALGWKGIELSAAFSGIGKQNKMLTRPMLYQRHATDWFQFTGEVVGTSWSAYNTPEQNLAAKYPRLSNTSIDSHGNSLETSDFWMYNGGYFRCKNITIGYSFQKNLLKKMRLDRLRIFASVSDPFSIDNYPQGWDPEVGKDGSEYMSRTWNFGVQVSF